MERLDFDTVLGTPHARALLASLGEPVHPAPSRYVREALRHGLERYGLEVLDESDDGALLRATLRGEPGGIRGFLVGVGGLLVPEALPAGSLGLLGVRSGTEEAFPDAALQQSMRQAGLEALDTLSWGRHGMLARFRGDADGVRSVAGILGAAFRWSTHAAQSYWNYTW